MHPVNRATSGSATVTVEAPQATAPSQLNGSRVTEATDPLLDPRIMQMAAGLAERDLRRTQAYEAQRAEIEELKKQAEEKLEASRREEEALNALILELESGMRTQQITHDQQVIAFQNEIQGLDGGAARTDADIEKEKTKREKQQTTIENVQSSLPHMAAVGRYLADYYRTPEQAEAEAAEKAAAIAAEAKRIADRAASFTMRRR